MDFVRERTKPIDTPYRRIVSPEFPVPESLPTLDKLKKYEARSMHSQPPVVWDRAEGFQAYDRFGNMWLDWSSGVLVTNAGHGCIEIQDAINEMTRKSLLHSYLFPTEIRAMAAEKLIKLTPKNLNKVFPLSTGAEAVENAIKTVRTYGESIHPKKIGILSFTGAFHGRTLGAQMIGGIPKLKEWISNFDPDFHVVPFPNCYLCPLGKERYEGCFEDCFHLIEEALTERGKSHNEVAGVITESYQGSGALFAPEGYMQLLYEWCKKHEIVLALDEIQAGFGRTGKWFAFQHYNVTPNLLVLGKGMSSSLPVSAVVGEERLMDLFDPGETTSTHGGNPICLAAMLASINVIEKNNLVENARLVGEHLKGRLLESMNKYPDKIGHVEGTGLVYGVYIVKTKGSKEPDGARAAEIVNRYIRKGLLTCAPIGKGGGMIKISPPLNITRDAIDDGILAFEEAVAEC